MSAEFRFADWLSYFQGLVTSFMWYKRLLTEYQLPDLISFKLKLQNRSTELIIWKAYRRRRSCSARKVAPAHAAQDAFIEFVVKVVLAVLGVILVVQFFLLYLKYVRSRIINRRRSSRETSSARPSDRSKTRSPSSTSTTSSSA